MAASKNIENANLAKAKNPLEKSKFSSSSFVATKERILTLQNFSLASPPRRNFTTFKAASVSRFITSRDFVRSEIFNVESGRIYFNQNTISHSLALPFEVKEIIEQIIASKPEFIELKGNFSKVDFEEILDVISKIGCVRSFDALLCYCPEVIDCEAFFKVINGNPNLENFNFSACRLGNELSKADYSCLKGHRNIKEFGSPYDELFAQDKTSENRKIEEFLDCYAAIFLVRLHRSKKEYDISKQGKLELFTRVIRDAVYENLLAKRPDESEENYDKRFFSIINAFENNKKFIRRALAQYPKFPKLIDEVEIDISQDLGQEASKYKVVAMLNKQQFIKCGHQLENCLASKVTSAIIRDSFFFEIRKGDDVLSVMEIYPDTSKESGKIPLIVREHKTKSHAFATDELKEVEDWFLQYVAENGDVEAAIKEKEAARIAYANRMGDVVENHFGIKLDSGDDELAKLFKILRKSLPPESREDMLKMALDERFLGDLLLEKNSTFPGIDSRESGKRIRALRWINLSEGSALHNLSARR